MTKAYIFDIDDTLFYRYSLEMLPGVKQFFSTLPNDRLVFLVTNQGGVGMRYWSAQMSNIETDWREPTGNKEVDKYPTEQSVFDRLDAIVAILNRYSDGVQILPFVSFSYVSKKGNWGPFPPLIKVEDPVNWEKRMRKPNPGMLLRAKKLAEQHLQRDVDHQEFIMIGDRDEDRDAAKNAGMPFEWASVFFRPYGRK
jgi:histidinol phosphatase-like enzyme